MAESNETSSKITCRSRRAVEQIISAVCSEIKKTLSKNSERIDEHCIRYIQKFREVKCFAFKRSCKSKIEVVIKILRIYPMLSVFYDTAAKYNCSLRTQRCYSCSLKKFTPGVPLPPPPCLLSV